MRFKHEPGREQQVGWFGICAARFWILFSGTFFVPCFSFFIKRFKVLGIRGIPRLKNSSMKKAVKEIKYTSPNKYIIQWASACFFTAFFIILFFTLGIPLIPSTLNRFMKKAVKDGEDT